MTKLFARKKEKEKAAKLAARPARKSDEEVGEALAAFRQRAKAEAKRFSDVTDSEFWVAVCFHSREDKDSFLDEFGLSSLGDKYLSGPAMAEVLRKKGG